MTQTSEEYNGCRAYLAEHLASQEQSRIDPTKSDLQQFMFSDKLSSILEVPYSL